MKTLHLTLKKKWFDMILRGEKKEEYRQIKQYWVRRLMELIEPFMQEQFGIRYNDINSAFCYSLGFKGSRPASIDFLLNETKCAKIKSFDVIQFTNGYSKNAPRMTVECRGITVGTTKPEWCDDVEKKVFVIKLGNVLHHMNCN